MVFTLAACSDDKTPSKTDGGTVGDASLVDSSLPDAVQPDSASTCKPADPPCQGESIQQLDLLDTVNPAQPQEEGQKAGEFLTLVDATAGGMNPTMSYIYLRFENDGVKKVAIDDQAALTNATWHLALRRFVIRINSGVSGPSCVVGARTAPNTTFEGLTSVPAGLSFEAEQYLTGTCGYVPDTSGLGSPATVLSNFWQYPGCVKMTNNVYVIRLDSGRHLKLQVASYYPPDNQKACDETGKVPVPSGGGAVRLRWAWLD